MNERDRKKHTATSRLDTSSLPRGPLNWVFFPAALLYHELLLRAFDRQSDFFTGTLVLVVLFALGAGLFWSLLINLFRHRQAATIVSIAATALWTVLVCVEYCCRSYFKSYFALSFIGNMASDVVGGFGDTVLPDVVLPRLPFILLAFVPLALCILLRRRIVTEQRMGRWSLLFLLVVCLLFGGIGSGLARWGTYHDAYTYNFTTDTGVTHFGLNASVRLEITYAIFGHPSPRLPDTDTKTDVPDDTPVVTTPVVYGENTMNIDFAALAENASSSAVARMSDYFGSLTPSKQNAYTGMFQGKNLILFTAESFSPWFIIEELTPTLYRLTHEGFVFSNYYQPGWGQSTTGGEFAVLTGLLPTWVGGDVSFWASRYDYMPLALGNQFRALGYQTPAWHNNTYNYYGRNATHPNLGYDYEGIGSGLTLATQDSSWPYSDLEMLETTLDSCVDAYLTTGQPFHAYYMTVSGHGSYNWGQSMAAKNRAAAEAAYPNASAPVQAYVAANLELEAALTYLVDQLEARGIADDTVICLSADHYPYALAETGVDYYAELTGRQDSDLDTSRYRNALILWCGGMDQPVTVDTPCSAVDIVPTLSNLFGLRYDSRLLSGRDILADNYDPASASGCIPLVVLPTPVGNSWATAAGVYEARTGTFTPAPGVTLEEGYVDAINRLVSAKYTYARLIIQYDYYRIVLGENFCVWKTTRLLPLLI